MMMMKKEKAPSANWSTTCHHFRANEAQTSSSFWFDRSWTDGIDGNDTWTGESVAPGMFSNQANASYQILTTRQVMGHSKSQLSTEWTIDTASLLMSSESKWASVCVCTMGKMSELPQLYVNQTTQTHTHYNEKTGEYWEYWERQ